MPLFLSLAMGHCVPRIRLFYRQRGFFSEEGERVYRFREFIELPLFLFGGQQEEGEVLSGGVVWRE